MSDPVWTEEHDITFAVDPEERAAHPRSGGNNLTHIIKRAGVEIARQPDLRAASLWVSGFVAGIDAENERIANRLTASEGPLGYVPGRVNRGAY